MATPEVHFTRIFLTLTRRNTDIITFRQLASAGEPLATATAEAQDSVLVRSILTDPQYDKYFLDRKQAVDLFGGPEALQRAFTEQKVATYRRLADAAGIILMHTAVDAAVSDCCRLSAAVSPSDWESRVEEKQVALRDVKAGDYADLLRSKLDLHIAALEKESLLKRADTLFQVCQPPAGYDPIRGYRYDRSELARLDQLRHDLVHGNHEGELAGVPEALEFLLKTGIFFWGLLNHRHGLRFDPMWMLQGEPSKTASSQS